MGACGIVGMTFLHGSRGEMYLWPTIVYLGLGFAFTAMPTLILGAVSSDKTGQATAMNMTLRSIGASLGIQVAATLVQSTAGPLGYPAGVGFTRAFAVMAAATCVAALVSLAIPRGRDHAPVTDVLVVGEFQSP